MAGGRTDDRSQVEAPDECENHRSLKRERGDGGLRDLAVVGSLAVTWALSGQRPFWRRISQISNPSLALQAFMTRVVSFLYDPAGAGLSWNFIDTLLSLFVVRHNQSFFLEWGQRSRGETKVTPDCLEFDDCDLESVRIVQSVLRRKLLPGILSLLLFLAVTDSADGRERIKYLNPTFTGSTGLFSLSKPTTLRRGEWSVALHGTSIHREPGDLNLTLFPLSVTLGVHDRLEFFLSWETYRRVRASAMGEGPGEFWTGLKLNLLSELSGAPLGWAVQAKTRFSIKDSRQRLLQGLTTGTTDAGFDLLFSKDIGDGPNLTGNAGILFVQDSFGVDRQHEFKYGVGLELPFWRDNSRLIGELVGTHFFGAHSPSTFANPVSPLDLLAGIRLLSFRRLHLSVAYRSNLRTIDPELLGIPQTGRHGWFLQVAFQRKINRPPSVQCSVDQEVLVEGDLTTIRVTVSDPDDEVLGITWTASSGRITLNGDSAIFDSTGLPAGQYTVNTELDDGENSSGCTVHILVRKKNLP